MLLRGDFLGAIIGLIIGIILAVAGYYIWAYIVQFAGKTLFGGQASVPQLLRTLGYALWPDRPGRLLVYLVRRPADRLCRRHLESCLRLFRRARRISSATARPLSRSSPAGWS